MKVPGRWFCGRVLPVLLGLTAAASADPEAQRALEEGKQFGLDTMRQVQDAARVAPDAQAVPGYRGSQPPEAGLYEQGLGLKDTARQRLPQNAAGAFTRGAALERPHFTLDPDADPLLRRGRGLQSDPAAQLGTPDSPVTECSARRLAGAPRYTEHRCTRWGGSEQLCERDLRPRCRRRRRCPNDRAGIELVDLASDMRWTYGYPTLTLGTIADNYWRGRCAVYDRRTTFSISSLERIAEFRLVSAGWDDHMRIVLNGRQVFIGPYQGNQLQTAGGAVSYGGRPVACEQNTSWHLENLDIDLKSQLREGENVLDMRVIVAGGGEGWIRIRAAQYCACEEWEERWDAGCDRLREAAVRRRCLQTDGRCLERGRRRVAGEELVRPCWRERQTYFCTSESSFVDERYCAELRARGCAQAGSECVDRNAQGRCIEYEQTYRCPERAVGSSVADCGTRVYCLAGDCFDTGYRASGDFGLAAAHLGAMEQAAQDFDAERLRIFQGQGRKCKKTAIGFSNCCKDNGWGVDLGLLQCSEEERLLSETRRAGQCHYVGSYKKGSLLLKRRYQAYCCFKSKLARIVQEQGRSQTGQGWGTARRPQCEGFTPQALAELDFEAMDFSEFYQDALQAARDAARPQSVALQALLQRRILERLRP